MEFDYLIVGAGSAGCVLANRLSANGRFTVAILEAGKKDSSPWIHIPVGYFKTMGNPDTDWMYHTQPDAGLNGRALSWPRGKVLGGSSSINGLLYVRGQPQDFDMWRQMGNIGWGWDDVLPYFKKSESYDGGDDAVRGRDGPLGVSPTKVSREVVDHWIEAAVNAGYKRAEDYNGKDQEGVNLFQLTARNGRRCSSAVAYLNPAKSRSNLTVFTQTQTERLIFEGSRVTGIVANSKGKKVTFSARKEVILSAGAIGSPQIMMLSGLGDAKDLAKHNVKSVLNIPGVGRNMQDHLQIRPIFKTDLPTINTEVSNIFKQGLIAMEYALKRTGPMTMAASLGVGFLKTDERLETPDIQFHIQPFSANTPEKGPHKFSAFTASVCQLRPESVGHIELASARPEDHPLIHPNYLDTGIDQQTAVKGVQVARKIAKVNPLADHITEEYAPGANIGEDDDDAILEWIRNNAVTIYHPTSTCRMGTDKMSVVDERLRVRGIEGLRVADASIMPRIVSGNTNAPSIMIGEKASDMILEDANR